MKQKLVTNLMPSDAYELIQNTPKCIFIDVRSKMEYQFVGHPIGSINIPWIDAPDWLKNPNFGTDVRSLSLGGLIRNNEFGGIPLILICRSGVRSLDAGLELYKQGVRNIYNVIDGFEGDLDENHHRGTLGGWRHEGLPWEQG
ncbi:MAG: rhodanese-like domain-containing protein [Gammaproteobacteria bacterium]|nr:rhodanese-like domain-containing protein [Gammaproteobacteria bacterium]